MSARYIDDYNIYQEYEAPLSTVEPNEFSVKKNLESKSKYPSWCTENGSMFSEQEILNIFLELGRIFQFQRDNVSNMFDHFMTQLDSRSSRMSCSTALLSLHVHYIGGDVANFKKWYFASQVDTEYETKKVKYKNLKKTSSKIKKKSAPYSLSDLEFQNGILGLEFIWKTKMNSYSERDYIYQLALWLLIWGEANNVRFMPECICFIYQCASDYLFHVKESEETEKPPLAISFTFLEGVIDPLYTYVKDQQYKLVNGEWKRREKDHSQIIGYDDINQTFWLSTTLKKIKLSEGSYLYDLPKHERYLNFNKIKWKFKKTFYEKRNWLHVLSNFSRIWIIHISMFWYYTCFNSPTLYTKGYDRSINNQPPLQVHLSAVSLGGTIACIIALFAAISETLFIPRTWPGARPILAKICLIVLITIINTGPSVYIFLFLPLDEKSHHGSIVSIIQFVVSVFTFIYFAIQSPDKLFSMVLGESANLKNTKAFTSSFPELSFKNQAFSYIIWVCVFLAKFVESYFFLTLSLRDPIRILSIMEIKNCQTNVSYVGDLVCKHQAKVTLILLYITNLVLFFLDTYLWYIICNCLFSVAHTFSFGISIFTPWKNIFSRLPDRIATKLIFNETESSIDTMLMVSQLWNSIVLSLYREHLISIEQVNKLVYQSADTLDMMSNRLNVRPPLFFVFQGDNSVTLNDFFTPGKDAERRISFFAQSISIPLPEPSPVSAIPAFTVLIPHYSERIILGLKETIKENKDSKVSLLDYLKQLHPNEWECFINDTKIWQSIKGEHEIEQDQVEETTTKQSAKEDIKEFTKAQVNDLPYYSVGFRNSSPEYTLRTRIWASLRYQTLYRTISGFMNYENALRLFQCIENQDSFSDRESDKEYLSKPELFTRSKFHLLLAMQRYQRLTDSEKSDADVLFKTFPSMKVAYLEEEIGADGVTNYYSTLLDISKREANGDYHKKYRIKLSGNPILGDGKSDNQNHALVFYRGEYIQVIDANQDNYLEECLKIKTILAEFEEMNVDVSSEYVPGIIKKQQNPVAIVGAREYIFSESIGILGDIAAGKEQTFGTLFSRTMGEIGGKLHYGHPDFLNAIFMTTRGGISKAQKGLHLNEDIYAGMTVACRGGRIKHCDYYQCGKGRDLGFGTILNFTTKIGAGMGEQILSREHYYLGSGLPIDRFLTFYYAHPGFHINNWFIMLSIQLFMMVLVNLGSMVHESVLCEYNRHGLITDPETPPDCYNLIPVLHWVSRFVLSIFICFFLSFLPLIIQELVEKGLVKTTSRIFYHFVSLSPLFEVFVCQIYARALKDNLVFGGAKYVSTGRGFATVRSSFASNYAKYADSAMYSGSEIFLKIVFATLSMWQPSLLWFWITIVSLCLGPFIFNPHQFEWGAFFLDYRDFLRWLSRGNRNSHINSWIDYTRSKRTKYTGYKKRKSIQPLKEVYVSRPSRSNTLLSQVMVPLFKSILLLIPYIFINSQKEVEDAQEVNPVLRILVVSVLPYVFNALILCISWAWSHTIGVFLGCCCKQGPAITAAIVHCSALIFNIVVFFVLMALQGWNYTQGLCGYIFMLEFQKTISNFMMVLIISRELKEDSSNRAWWSGKWRGSGLGWLILSQPLREFLVKVLELNAFTYDFILGHCLFFSMTPLLFIPMIDKWHSLMLFWLKPSECFKNPIYSKKIRNQRRAKIIKYATLYFVVFVTAAMLVVAPVMARSQIPDFKSALPNSLEPLFQPQITKPQTAIY